MKRIEIFIKVVALAVFALSCSQQVEPTAQFAKNKNAVTLNSSLSTVSPTMADSVTSVVSFTWNDPKFTGGLDQTMFTLLLSPTGTNFASFTSKSFSGVTTGALLGKEINGMAFKLGGTVGNTISLDVMVVASLSNNTQPISSNVIKLTYSPYGDFSLSATTMTKVLSAASAGSNADTLSWGTAFKGYAGVKKYVMQYAAGGTSFASISTVSISGSSKIFTQQNLNDIAYGAGGKANTATPVDFRIAATDEQNNIMYSNVVTLTITPWAGYNSIGLIGDFTGWGNDVDLYRPDPINSPASWTVVVKLTNGGGVKFRYDDMWNLPGPNGASTAWGGTTWPSGTGDLNTGNNISVGGASGYYQVNFNAGTGAYSFTLLTIPTGIAKMSVIGSSTPGGDWSTDLELAQSGTDLNVWTGTVALTAGQLKFRANDTWPPNTGGYNWGSSYSSPTGLSGWATQSGGNININTADTYFVYINIGTGEYFFGSVTGNSAAATPQAQISLIGDFDGWPNDTSDPGLIQNPQNPYEWSAKIAITVGGAKFRANHSWTNPPNPNWGGTTFPSGIAVVPGSNISVTTGTYQITFNSATGEYYFWQ